MNNEKEIYLEGVLENQNVNLNLEKPKYCQILHS